MSFHFSWSIDTIVVESGDKWWSELFFLFCRNGSPRTAGHFSFATGFPSLFQKLADVFVHSLADLNPGLWSIVLRGINLVFNSILFQMIRNLTFQSWANFRVSSIPYFRGGSFIIWRWRKFSATFASFSQSNVFCYISASFAVTPQQVSLCWNIVRRWIR